ncbi:ABC transporter permease [Euzebya pacifica]|uniref:ABC transporter permease n=1 Tax=Euzebya pacifica TaxID=1608957 RepID=UPI0030FBB33C
MTSVPAHDPGTTVARLRRIGGSQAVLPVIALVLLLLFWEAAVAVLDMDPTMAAPPSRVLAAIPDVVTGDAYIPALLETLRLVTMGYAIAIVLGIVLGVLAGRVDFLDRSLTPLINGAYSAPLPALVPIITAAFGIALQAKLLIVVALAIFPILINTHQGIVETDDKLVEVGRSFRSSTGQMLRDVILPGAVPFMLVGLRLGAARALVGTVVAEFYTSPKGLGYQILVYSRRFDVASVFVPVLTLTIMALLAVRMLNVLERRLVPWTKR